MNDETVAQKKFFVQPDRKVNVGGAMTFLSTMLAWGINEFAGVTIPAEVGIAFAGFATYVVQFVVPNKQ